MEDRIMISRNMGFEANKIHSRVKSVASMEEELLDCEIIYHSSLQWYVFLSWCLVKHRYSFYFTFTFS